MNTCPIITRNGHICERIGFLDGLCIIHHQMIKRQNQILDFFEKSPNQWFDFHEIQKYFIKEEYHLRTVLNNLVKQEQLIVKTEHKRKGRLCFKFYKYQKGE